MESVTVTDKTEVHFYKCSGCFYLYSSEKLINVLCPECGGNLVEENMRSKEELYRTPYSELTNEELIQLINYGISEKNQLNLEYQETQRELELTRKDLSKKEEFIKSLSNLVKAVKEMKYIDLY